MQGLTAVCLILSIATVVLTVAAQVKRDAFLFPCALELAWQTDVCLWEWKQAGEEGGCINKKCQTKQTIYTTNTATHWW